MLKCKTMPTAGSYVDHSVYAAKKCSGWSTQPVYSHQYEGCPKWTDPGRGNDYRIFIDGQNRETDITRSGSGPRKTGDYQSNFSYLSEHHHSGGQGLLKGGGEGFPMFQQPLKDATNRGVPSNAYHTQKYDLGDHETQ